MESPAHMKKRLFQELKRFQLSQKEIDQAVDAGYQEREACLRDIRQKGEDSLRWLEQTGRKGIILAGRPYHVDPEIHHGIPEMITSLGLAVLTEDSVCHLGPQDYALNVINQWVYHSRLYAAAAFAGTRDDLELVQLNSFGCGIDAVTTDQVADILESRHKTYTLVKIDEINNLGAVRIRIRSLLAAMQERERKGVKSCKAAPKAERIVFTKEMRQTHTILCPQMAPIHFSLFQELLRLEGYDLEVLSDEGPEVVEQGLLHVHNDACYPSILVIGQMMAALKSGRYDLEHTALLMSQTGGGCRASNYIAFLRKALREAGMEQVPVISANALGWEKNPGFKIGLAAARKAVMACIYGDLLMKLTYATRPYEVRPGQTDQLLDSCIAGFKKALKRLNKEQFRQVVRATVTRYATVATQAAAKPKVGIVGEILVKYHPFANNYIVDIIEKEGGEAVVPGLTEFFLASAANVEFKQRYLVGSRSSVLLAKLGERWIESYRDIVREALQSAKRYEPLGTMKELVGMTEEVIQLGHQSGEGWLLTGEMAELLHSGVDNIACLQPFACLPNHIVGKGMIRELRRHYPQANIVPLDYDPGASQVNQINRIKLMMSVAYKNLEARLTAEAGGQQVLPPGASPPEHEIAWESKSYMS
jgi:predicted nucleotide-binding protein (sugar kinase/HSP70/actin superfamily)